MSTVLNIKINFGKVYKKHLIARWVDDNDQLEMLPLVERHLVDFLLSFPYPVLESVEDHFVPELKTRVEVESNIASFKFTTHQIYMKPVGCCSEGQNYLLPSNINTDKVINVPSLCNRPRGHHAYRNQDKNCCINVSFMWVLMWETLWILIVWVLPASCTLCDMKNKRKHL